MRTIRQLWIVRRDIEHGEKPSVRIEDRRARTAQIDVPCAVMLASVDRDRPLLGDGRPDAICAFHRFCPHAAKPDAPMFELARHPVIGTVVYRDTSTIAE